MFNSLSTKLTETLNKLRRKGVLGEEDIEAALREVRIALLEADVALPVVKDFIAKLKEQAVGTEILKGINPGQMVVKLVHDALVDLLGHDASELALSTNPPTVILMVGLQGSGKTTTTGKIAKWLKDKKRLRVMVASLDIYRPAAQEQLAQVAARAGVEALPIIEGQLPEAITERAMKEARLGGIDVLLLDTAGRLHIDDELMAELKRVKAFANPHETLLVADALTGQDAVTIAKQFHESIGVTGMVLTRLDGDGRGGAALSMRAITGQPIKFAGMGEKLEALEAFDPKRIAGRILDMGDVVSLVEKAAEMVSQDEAEAMAKRMQSGQFDFNDLLDQLRKMKKMGGMKAMLSMLPGAGAMMKAAEDKLDDKILARQEALILSMTPKERAHPKLLNGPRKIRIAKGAGMDVQDVNRLIKQYQQMETMMKKMKKMSGKGGFKGSMADIKQMFGG